LAPEGRNQLLDMDGLAVARRNAVVEQDPHRLQDLPALGAVTGEVAGHDAAVVSRQGADDFHASFGDHQECYEAAAAGAGDLSRPRARVESGSHHLIDVAAADVVGKTLL